MTIQHFLGRRMGRKYRLWYYKKHGVYLWGIKGYLKDDIPPQDAFRDFDNYFELKDIKFTNGTTKSSSGDAG